jgi:hypothetical protein
MKKKNIDDMGHTCNSQTETLYLLRIRDEIFISYPKINIIAKQVKLI